MRRLLMLALLSAATVCSASERDADALIASLAKPAPATVEFTEVRFSRLVREPLVVSGELGYSGPTSLDRRVTTPYRENTSIRGESVKVAREGEKSRSFALKHAPELRGLLTGFSALLAGDANALRQTFTVDATGKGDDWILTLRPKDTQAQRRLDRMVISGSGTDPRCFSMLTADGANSVLVLGEAAKEPRLKDMNQQLLYGYCRFDGPDMPATSAPAGH